ncbi:hypothetical protein KCU94_g22452, partial [Aureobasidium melanogenum]
MRTSSWRAVSLLLLCLLLAFVNCQDAGLNQQDGSHHDTTPYLTTEQDHPETHTKLPHEQSPAVKDALTSLRKIRPATSRLARLSKPSGLVGKTIHYAKELFVLLFMNQPDQKDLLITDATPLPLSPILSRAV